ncbi:MAG: MMPL family transporter [Myxococcota bacterium]|nr:MMPL family transporter [Myxococcota bacterium]
MSTHRAERLGAWIQPRRWKVLAVAAVVTIAGILIAAQMGIKSDLTNLLPRSKASVRDLTKLQQRARPFGTVHVIIESPDPTARARAAAALVPRLQGIEPTLVQQFSQDDSVLRRYIWERRFLFADLKELTSARDALDKKVNTNPLLIDIDEDEAPTTDRLAELEKKLAELEQGATKPPLWVSKDGTLQQVSLQTTFSASDATKARKLTEHIRAEAAAVKKTEPNVTFSLTGNVTLTMYEHDSVLEGMALSAGITVVLCAFGLLLYYRSWRLVAAMLASLFVGVAATFALARIVVGNLNVMTAFLFAIVVGNGINAGMLLVARYLEELRAGKDARAAVGSAMGGAWHGTLAATATAFIAYMSLLVTDFRGFREFGAIAGGGMALTWFSAFTVLPAALYVIAPKAHFPGPPPLLGALLERLLPERRAKVVMLFGAVITTLAIVVTVRFIADDPFLHDWRDLQSTTDEIEEIRTTSDRTREKLEPRSQLTGQAYQVVIAVDKREMVGPIVEKIRAEDAARPPAQRWTQDARSLEDLIPANQTEKIAVLAEIRALIDSPKLQANIDDEERTLLAKLRPPDAIATVTEKDVPHDLSWPFVEKDGSTGKLVVIRGAKRFDSFNVDHRLAFAAEVRKIKLPEGALVAGEPLVVADIIETMEDDAPKMILFALIGSIIAVILVLGLRRHSAVTIACGLAGVVVMIATCFLVGLRVHFLDLIALPITIGIGIDYAVNLAARDQQEGERGTGHLLRTTGGTVLLCSFTTSVGYGTLMLSANGGIRAFGMAALIGEIACILMALVVAPACLALLRQRKTGNFVAGQVNQSPPIGSPR